MRSLHRQEAAIRTQQRTPEELLQEIRNLLTPKDKEIASKKLEEDEIEEILKKSFETYKKIELKNSHSHLKQRANEAIQIVQSHHSQPFVQHYTKQKVQSEMFFNLRGPLAQHETRQFQRQRQELQKQLAIEEEEQRRKQERAISSRKKFIRYQSKQLLYGTISELTMREGDSSLPYLINQPAQKHQKSTNNLIDEPSKQLEGIYETLKKDTLQHSKSAKLIKEVDEQVIEIVDDDETMNQSYIRRQAQLKLQQALRKSPNFLKTFKRIIEKSFAYNKYLTEEKRPQANRNSLDRNENIITYSGSPTYFNHNKEMCPESVVELTRDYRSKGILLREIKERSIVKEQKFICDKIISKMNGDSTDFHPRKARLKDDQLIWCAQNEQFTFDSKKVGLIVQEIKTLQCYKQQGSCFSKVKTEVEVVHVRGKDRDLKFEKNFLQGRQLYKQLCILMAKKLLHLNMLLTCRVNPQLLQFVNNNKAKTFSLASDSLEDYEKYPDKDYKLMIINILSALFAFRTQVTRLDLTGVKFNMLETASIIKSIHPLVNLQTILISQTKFNAETFNLLMQTIAKLSCQRLNIRLAQCFIDDQIIRKAKPNLIKCTNIEKLDLSSNDITLLGFGVLIDLASQDNCQLRQLNISQCKLKNLISLGEFIKRAKRLEAVFAEDCGFNLSNDEEVSSFFNCCKNCKVTNISLRNNELVNNLHPFEEFWVSETPRQIVLDVGTFAEKTSKNLQGRLLSP